VRLFATLYFRLEKITTRRSARHPPESGGNCRSIFIFRGQPKIHGRQQPHSLRFSGAGGEEDYVAMERESVSSM